MTATCPACGKPLPADAPAGLCPQCLLIGGLETSASPPAVDFTPPAITELGPLFPQLEIIELLGAGGMGAVYKARQPHLDRIVALKVLPPRDDPTFAERFTREARTLAKLNHPAIVHVYDFGQAGGHSYIVMEYVEGVNLRQAERAGKMTPVEALAIVPQICAALQFAHEAGIVHRDIKPENILLDAKGRVKIADFGLAKLLGAASPQHLTGTHQAMGTIHYMAPEQWEKPAAVDHRADIYSLGVVFYELLTGELPLGRFAPPSQKVRVDVRLDDVVLRTLEKEPDRRYQHASDVQTDVERIQTTAPGPTSLATAPPAGAVAKPNVFLWLVLPAVPIIGLAVAAGLGSSHTLDSLAAAVALAGSPLVILGNVLAWLAWRRQRPELLYSVTIWSAAVCLVGSAGTLLSWIRLSGIPAVFFELTIYMTGLELKWHLGKVIAGVFLMLAATTIVTARRPAMRQWRPPVIAGGAILVLIAWGYFFATTESHPMAVGQMTLGDKTTDISRSVNAMILPAAYFPPILALLLLACAAIESGDWPVAQLGSGMPAVTSVAPSVSTPTTRISFFRAVMLPVLALVVLGLVAYQVSGSAVHQVTQRTAEAILMGVIMVGPVIALGLLIRWLWLTAAPRHRMGFWLLAAALITVLPTAYTVVGSFAAVRIVPAQMQTGRLDEPLEWSREKLIGTWVGGGGARLVFRRDATFDEFGIDLYDQTSGALSPPADRTWKASGIYTWVGRDTIQIGMDDRSSRNVKIAVGENAANQDVLVIYSLNGRDRTMKRSP